MRRLLIALLSVTLAASMTAAPARAASGDLWILPVADPTGVETRLALGPGGVHHIVVPNVEYNGGIYAVDRGNRWSVQNLVGLPKGLGLDPAGHVFILRDAENASGQNGPRLHLDTDATGVMTSEDVPGSDHASASALAVGPDGTVHVAWTNGDWNLCYASRTDGTWSSVRTLTSKLPRANAMAMAIDGNGTPHVLTSGTLHSAGDGPPGCDTLAIAACIVDVAMTDPATLTAVSPDNRFWLDATTGSDGTIEAVTATDQSLIHLSNAGGPWSSETIATGNIIAGSIRQGPNGLVAFFGMGDNSGVRRADLVGTSWQVTNLNVGVGGPEAYGVVDANDQPHVAYTFSWNHPNDGGYVPTLMLVAPDDVAPIVGTPLAKPTAGKVVGSTIATTISWSATDALSGLARYQLQQSTSGGSWATVSSTLTTRSAVRNLVPARAYAFRARGVDADGNVGTFATGPTIKITTSQQTSSALVYGGTWHTSTASAYFGGSTRYATSSSAYARLTTSMRGFAWVSTYGPTRGSVRIYVDGVWVTTVSLHRSSSTYRVVAWSIGWSTAGTHTVMIKPVGTAGAPRVDLDGYVLVR